MIQIDHVWLLVQIYHHLVIDGDLVQGCHGDNRTGNVHERLIGHVRNVLENDHVTVGQHGVGNFQFA